jgi:hypothetical protein
MLATMIGWRLIDQCFLLRGKGFDGWAKDFANEKKTSFANNL